MFLSSRASYELVRKAARVDVPMLATISAPSFAGHCDCAQGRRAAGELLPRKRLRRLRHFAADAGVTVARPGVNCAARPATRRQSNCRKSGLRFSKNALNASRASGASSILPKCTASSLHLRLQFLVACALHQTSCVTRNDEAGNAASFAACASANASTSAAGSRRFTKPMRCGFVRVERFAEQQLFRRAPDNRRCAATAGSTPLPDTARAARTAARTSRVRPA